MNRSKKTISPASIPSAFSRVVIENVRPQVDNGRFPIKRVTGDSVGVSGFIHADGHDTLTAVLQWRKKGESPWKEIPMVLRGPGTDIWDASFVVDTMGRYEYTIEAWIDPFLSWRKELSKKVEAGQDVALVLEEGARMMERVSKKPSLSEATLFKEKTHQLRNAASPEAGRMAAEDPTLAAAMFRCSERRGAARAQTIYQVLVERPRAAYGAWYEMFPRSTSTIPGRAGTLKDCKDRLSYVADMGFDVVYLPPIHPIGKSFRKGPNNTLNPGPKDPGSPWAIGGSAGGHKSVHPDLGTLADFDALVAEAKRLKLELALDIAFQCSPDHPYVKEHPEWFSHRPDNTIKYAENPPKKYQDIYPLNFECDAWQALWEELKSVFTFWAARGVRVFRVDNPHTKPFPFWEWVIAEVRKDYPDSVFLAEAFTRPPVLKFLAKSGFSQSYTYFTWRNTKKELTDYFTELTQTSVREYLRPNLFANTPDILHEYLQTGGRPAHQIRFALAATLGATYGIYGPVFELAENAAIHGTEEYLNSEKYQVRYWNLNQGDPLRDFIAHVNAIRRVNPALQSNGGLRFHPIDNESLLAYSKSNTDGTNLLLTVVNLDPYTPQSGWVTLPTAEWGLSAGESYQVHDLVSDARYFWHGDRNYIRLDPAATPVHIFRLRRKIKTEKDFDYFL